MNSENLNKLVLTLDIGATNTRIALINNNGEIIDIKKLTTPQNNFLEEIKKTIRIFCEKNNEIEAISISVAGPVNNNRARFTNIQNNPEVSCSDFLDFNEKVFLINDASAAAYGEAKKHKTKNLAFITISSGIGGGIIKDGVLVNFTDTNSEIGHWEIPSSFSVHCGCGGMNHWESYSSGKNLPAFYTLWREKNGLSRINIPSLSAMDIFQRAKNDDLESRDFIFSGLGPINSYAINLVIDKYNPELIVFSGPVVLQNIDLFLEGINTKKIEKSKFVFASQTDELCLLGAASFAFDNL